jgi:hypothetical protein
MADKVVARKTWADIMSDDEDDYDFFASQGRKGDLIREDTYQGSAHPDADASKAGVNLVMATVDFSDNSCSLTTPSRGKRQHNLDKPTETEKPSPKAKVPRVDPEMKDSGKEAFALDRPSENAKEEIEGIAPASAWAKGPPLLLRSREVLEGAAEAAKSPQKNDAIDWDRRRETRQKQIEKAMDTEGYRRYKKLFPVAGPKDPRTPRPDSRTERKAFDFELKVWKTFLHKFDNVPVDLADIK